MVIVAPVRGLTNFMFSSSGARDVTPVTLSRAANARKIDVTGPGRCLVDRLDAGHRRACPELLVPAETFDDRSADGTDAADRDAERRGDLGVARLGLVKQHRRQLSVMLQEPFTAAVK